ncbi:kinase-like domain-containing protein, partial [Penicillium cinerascens]
KSDQVPVVASSSQGTSKDYPDAVQAQRSPGATTEPERSSQASFPDEYGKFIKVVYYNKTSTVQLYEKKAAATEPISSPTKSRRNSMFTKLRRASMPKATIRELYAVKVFHETKPDSRQVLLSRDRSGDSPLSHPNILSIIEVLYNKQGNLCLVMPFCIGGNLHTFLQREARAKEYLPVEEVDCLGVQILRAVGFLHEWGIAHGDLRPEHVLLTGRSAIKVSGFGEDEDAVRKLVRLLNHGSSTSSPSGLKPGEVAESNSKPLLCIHRGVSEPSTPYLPPERFSSRRDSVRQGYTHQHIYDIRAGDIWACGMIYMLLRAGELPWRSAQRIDPKKSYSEYLHSRLKEDGYGPIQALEMHCRNVVYAMLHPDPGLRITAEEILRSEWALSTSVCEIGEKGL